MAGETKNISSVLNSYSSSEVKVSKGLASYFQFDICGSHLQRIITMLIVSLCWVRSKIFLLLCFFAAQNYIGGRGKTNKTLPLGTSHGTW